MIPLDKGIDQYLRINNPRPNQLQIMHRLTTPSNVEVIPTISTFDVKAGLAGFYSDGILHDLAALGYLARQLPWDRGRLVIHPHRKGIDEMELQDSVTPLTNLPLSLLGDWDQLKNSTDDVEDSVDPEETIALHSNTGNQAPRALANSESAQTQASFDDEFSAEQPGTDYARASEDQLLAAAKASDGRAFEELSNKYLRSIRKRVYSIVRNPEDTEDVVQDSLLKAYRHLPEFRQSCDFATWITKIAINTALMLLRKRRSRREVSFNQFGENDEKWSMWDIPDPAPNTEQAYARKETLAFMSRVVNGLPPVYRSVLEQYHAQEKSLRESADKLGITVASAKSRLFRARRRLRSRLGQQISILDACY